MKFHVPKIASVSYTGRYLNTGPASVGGLRGNSSARTGCIEIADFLHAFQGPIGSGSSFAKLTVGLEDPFFGMSYKIVKAIEIPRGGIIGRCICRTRHPRPETRLPRCGRPAGCGRVFRLLSALPHRYLPHYLPRYGVRRTYPPSPEAHTVYRPTPCTVRCGLWNTWWYERTEVLCETIEASPCLRSRLLCANSEKHTACSRLMASILQLYF